MNYTSNNPKYRTLTHSVPNAKNECGREWRNLPSECPRCNTVAGFEDAHGHYDNGHCEYEPCRKHGGPE